MYSSEQVSDLQKPSRKGKEREQSHRDTTAPTDLAARMIAFQRRTAGETRPRERAERPVKVPSPRVQERAPASAPKSPQLARKHHQTPIVLVSDSDADAEEFSRRLTISNSPRPSAATKHQKQLYNPDSSQRQHTRITAEPESISDATSSSYVHIPRGSSSQRDSAPRQLFDPRKDDPVRFAVQARPNGPNSRTPVSKSSTDYISASSTSSYSVASSNFTLSSNTDDSSASSALFDRQGRPSEESVNTNVFAVQLKKLYRTITNLEDKIKQEDVEDAAEDSRVLLKGKQPEAESVEREMWKRKIADHKQLAELIHNLLEISLSPSVPTSLRSIPTKYSITIRLWTYGFYKLLESLRRASFESPLALEHLQDFIYYAYTFYTGLLEEPTLASFKGGWLESLGDLARYRMAVAAMVASTSNEGVPLTKDALSLVASQAAASGSRSPSPSGQEGPKSVSDKPAARIDDSPSPSIGIAAARALELEPEKERWRAIARDWYGAGLADTPGTGKLHHHLGLLSREVEGEELRGIYHFVKSMTTLHPFTTSRESVLPMWSIQAQQRRAMPDARASELFVLLHGMLFTNIQLDDFQPTLARFIERLQIEGAEERDWIMMGVVNIGSVLEYGKLQGVLKTKGAVGRETGTGPSAQSLAAGMKVMAKRGLVDDADRMNVDEPVQADSTPQEYPAPLKMALQLMFAILSHVLKNPTRKASQYSRSTLNPYLAITLTFLATLLKHPATLSLFERSMPWDDLAFFFTTVPRGIMTSQGLLAGGSPRASNERPTMLTTGCSPPLPEDWCLRGMEWLGRRVYERGYWNSGEERRMELEVLDKSEAGDVTDGIIEDEEDDSHSSGQHSEIGNRWIRVVRCAVAIAGAVDGFTWVEGTREWKVEGALEAKVQRWREEERMEREEEARRRMKNRWRDDSMDVDEAEDPSEESEDDEDDSAEIKMLKARRRYLRNLLQTPQREVVPTLRPRKPRASREQVASRPALPIVAGYTVLVVDTNILLSSLSLLASVIESLRWTVIIPLPVIMELDGLCSNNSPQLAEAAGAAIGYLTSHIRSHASSLKVQTSKGNYLMNLSVRSEHVDFSEGGDAQERSMDDLILKAAIWQDEHWLDRSAMLRGRPTEKDVAKAVKVVLLSLDRNLRLKARSRQLPAASEKDLAAIFVSGT